MQLQPSGALPKIMFARYYGSNLPRFLSVDPGFDVHLGAPQSWNLYAYVRNNPVNATDPTGAYGRGTGFTDKQWEKFDAAQQEAADDAEGAAEDLEAAAEELENLEEGEEPSEQTQKTVKEFEKKTGESGNVAERMQSAAGNFRKSAEALRDDGSKGYVANAVTSPTAPAAVTRGKVMTVNTASQRWYRDRPHMVGHEALHSAGLKDQFFRNHVMYRESGFLKMFAKQRPDLAIKNPDSLLWFAE